VNLSDRELILIKRALYERMKQLDKNDKTVKELSELFIKIVEWQIHRES
jgi:hypothetical protein